LTLLTFSNISSLEFPTKTSISSIILLPILLPNWRFTLPSALVYHKGT